MNYRKLLFWMGVSCLFSITLTALRVVYTGTLTYCFLPWNLFLSSVPLVLSIFIYKRPDMAKYKLIPLLGIWLLFLPNAPYMLTDLFHLNTRPPVPLWFDLILILSFAWNGLVHFYLSIELVRRRFKASIGRPLLTIMLHATIFLSAFGVYLGRFLRWNSWDIISDPLTLLADIVHRFIYPLAHPSTWGMTIIAGMFLVMGYHMLKVLAKLALETMAEEGRR